MHSSNIIQKFITIIEDVKSFVPLLGVDENLLIDFIIHKRPYSRETIIQSLSFLEAQGEISKSNNIYFLEKI